MDYEKKPVKFINSFLSVKAVMFIFFMNFPGSLDRGLAGQMKYGL